MRSLLLVTSFTILVGLSAARPSYAQAPAQAEDVAAARALGIQGIKLADAGNCPEAIEKLERAEALYHAPSILGRLGECQVEVGRIVLGTENLNRVVREQLAPNAPAAFIAAQERAKKVLERALPRIAYLVVRVDPSTANPQVTVGGAPVQSALLGAERPTDPGSYEVVAQAPGYRTARANVTLAEGAHQDISLVLTPDPDAQPATPAPALPPPRADVAPAPSPAPEPPSASKSHTPAYIALGIGGAGLLIGSVTGIIAMAKEDALECPNKRCPPPEHDKLDSANTMATVSTIGFGVGLVGAAVGTVLLLTGNKGEAAPSATVGSLRARPWVSGQFAGLEGAF